jgi:ABC-type glycerol-3-phosphate transport system permease component
MRQVFLNIPSQLEDAARVDGASNLRICFQIMMPLAAGGMILVAVMQFVSVWGDYLTCRIMIDYADKMTLAYGMSFLYVATPASGVVSSYGAQATAIIFTVLPTVLVFILLQKWFIRGALEGLKM